jgi:UMF1 family MFS transporter
MFDFANSSYTTVIVTFAFSIFFTRLVAAGPEADLWWGRAITISNLIVLLLSPVVGAMADASGMKKPYLFASYALCVSATALLWFVEPGQIGFALLLFVLSNVAFSFGENFASSFLPELATPQTVGRISGFGWGLGYFGGLLSLLLVFPFVRYGFVPEQYDRIRWSWPVTALFFFVAGLPTFLWLRERTPRRPLSLVTAARMGFSRLLQTVQAVTHFQELIKFLGIFWFYSIGLTSIIAFVSVYAERTIGLSVPELLVLLLVLQIASALGAFSFGFLQDFWGARRTIQTTLGIWIAVSIAVVSSTNKAVFWVAALVAGLGIGSLQAASRALVASFSPTLKSGEFFGLWGLTGKAAYALGPLLFGYISSMTGSQKAAALVNGCFFLVGALGMFLIHEAAGVRAAEDWEELDRRVSEPVEVALAPEP